LHHDYAQRNGRRTGAGVTGVTVVVMIGAVSDADCGNAGGRACPEEPHGGVDTYGALPTRLPNACA